jgi:6-phosphogluconolactonase (cycloisomerase 2 family)
MRAESSDGTPASRGSERRRRGGLTAPCAAALAALAIAAGAWGATGALTARGCVDDNDSGADSCEQMTNGLNGANSVAVSPDGRSVYAASFDDAAIVRLKRNRTTGALTPKGCVDDNDSGADSCGQMTNGLDGAVSVAVSGDGRSVYAASDFDSAIVRLKRNRTTGRVTPKGCVDDNDSGPDSCGQMTNGLAGAISVAVSRDGRSLYAASLSDHAIVRFKRDRTTGRLTPRGCIDDNDTGADSCAKMTNGLDGANSVTVSGDGRSVYATSQFDDAIVRFKRNRTTGALTPKGCIDDNDTGADSCGQMTEGLAGAVSIAVSTGGRSVYAASFGDDAVVRFKRQPARRRSR